MEFLLILSIMLSFAVSFVLVPWWIKRAEYADLVGRDVNKLGKPKVAEVGGLPVLVGFLIGIFSYLAIQTFLFNVTYYNPYLFAAIITIILSTLVGLIDDILGWRIGLKQWQKPLLCILAALPLVVINAGQSVMHIPALGPVHFGWIYPVIIIPIIISGMANAFNMIAGYNGLEAGMGVIILTTLGWIVWTVQGNGQVALLAGMMAAALLAFLIFNWFPARVFPGDTLTYMVGSAIGVVTILGNVEKYALILFIPYFFEFVLESRVGWKVWVFGKINEAGKLVPAHKEFIGLESFAIRLAGRLTNKHVEKGTVLLFLGAELLIAIGIIIPFL